MALDHLLAALERDARSQAEARLKRARDEASALLEENRVRLAQERAAGLEALEAELRESAGLRLVEARRAALRKILVARQRLFERVLETARGRLREAQDDETFRAALPETIAGMLEFVGDRPAVLSCPAALRDAVTSAVRDRKGVTVSVDATIVAGARVGTLDGAVVVDGTLEARLEEMRPVLMLGMLRDLEEGS